MKDKNGVSLVRNTKKVDKNEVWNYLQLVKDFDELVKKTKTKEMNKKDKL